MSKEGYCVFCEPKDKEIAKLKALASSRFILEFGMGNKRDFILALHGEDFANAIDHFSEFSLRPRIKYGELPADQRKLLEVLRDELYAELHDRGISVEMLT